MLHRTMTYTYTKNVAGLFVCPKCGVTKEKQNTMHYHLKTHETKLPFECGFCKKTFLHASTLELHKRAQHTKETEKLMKCSVHGCPFKGTLTKANLLIHFVRKHCADEVQATLETRVDDYKCKICSKSMKSLTAFHYHAITCINVQDTKMADCLKQIQAL